MKKSTSNSIAKSYFDKTTKAQLESNIQKELELLNAQVWYDRHACRMNRLKNGEIVIIDTNAGETYSGTREKISSHILAQAISNAKKVEKQYGRKNLGPWTGFEWGMIIGKRDALNSLIDDQCD